MMGKISLLLHQPMLTIDIQALDDIKILQWQLVDKVELRLNPCLMDIGIMNRIFHLAQIFDIFQRLQ